MKPEKGLNVKVRIKELGKWFWRSGRIYRDSGGIYKLQLLKGFPKRVDREIILPYELDKIVFPISRRKRIVILDMDQLKLAGKDNNGVIKLQDASDSFSYPSQDIIEFAAKLKTRILSMLYEEQYWDRYKKQLIIVSAAFAFVFLIGMVFMYLNYQQLLEYFKGILPRSPAGG